MLYKQVIDRALGTKILRCMLEMEGCEPLLSGVMQCYVQPKDPAYADHMRYFVGNDVAVVEDLTAVPEPFLKTAYRAGCGRDDAACGFRYGVGGPAAAGLR